MSNPQYPGQPGDLPPTQVAPGAGVPPQGYPPQQPPQGYPPQQPPQTPYGAPGGGGGYGPPPFGAPPTGGGGGKKIGLIIGIIVAVLVLIGGGITAAILLLGGDDDGDDNDAKDPVTVTRTAETSDATTDATDATEVTTPPTEVTSEPTETGGLPAEDPQIVSQAYLDSLVTGNCLAVQGLSTEEWFSSEYGDQKGCKRASGNQQMSSAVYDFDEATDNGDGTVTQTATVTDSTDTSGTEYTATWNLVPNDDNTSWLVDGFQLV